VERHTGVHWRVKPSDVLDDAELPYWILVEVQDVSVEARIGGHIWHHENSSLIQGVTEDQRFHALVHIA
jgi:hypothetical protein